MQSLYIASSRELKRLDSIAFSPIFQHFGETLAGLTSVRAFRKQPMFLQQNRVSVVEAVERAMFLQQTG